MKNEFGEVIRFDRRVDNGNGSETDKVVVDVGTQTDRPVDEWKVSWQSCFVFLFCEKPTAKEMLYPNKSVRVKRAIAFAEDCKRKMEVDSYLNKN